MGGLGGEDLANWKRHVGVGRLGIRLECLILGFFGSREQTRVASAQGSFDVAPCAKDGAHGSSALLYVVYAFLMKHRFEDSSKLSTGERLGQEIFLQGFVFELLTDFFEAFLTIDQCLNDRAQRGFNLFKIF